jgi:pSer/pThr/pTyr-binding forkhead associated (FHA) protein
MEFEGRAMNEQPTVPRIATPIEPLRLRMQPGGYTIDLNEPDLVLGRHSEADLRVPLPDVSRRHCRFVHSDAGWELIDLGSLNGVYVNGARVAKAMLHAGDTVRICSIEFEVNPVDRSAVALSINSFVEAMDSMTRRAS